MSASNVGLVKSTSVGRQQSQGPAIKVCPRNIPSSYKFGSHVIMGYCNKKITVTTYCRKNLAQQADFNFEEYRTVFAEKFLGFDQLKEERPR